MFCEVFLGKFDLESRYRTLPRAPSFGVTDGKSLYDSIKAANPGHLSDPESAFDVIRIKQAVDRTGGVARWTHSGHQLADGLTKGEGNLADALRFAFLSRAHNIRDEELILARRAQLEQERMERGKANQQSRWPHEG